jgi:hypothetical protein
VKIEERKGQNAKYKLGYGVCLPERQEICMHSTGIIAVLNPYQMGEIGQRIGDSQ